MDYLSHNVSENLKRIRQSKGMSLDQVAEQTGVSKSMLAQIEKGTANPSIGVLGKITSGLLTVECHDHVQEIHRGQVYKFETDQPHLYRNDGDRVASCMCFFLDYTNIR